MSALLRAARSYGAGWLAKRLAYEVEVRSGFQAFRFPKRAWDQNELERWLKAGFPFDPPAYGDWWRANRRPFFFAPADQKTYGPLLNQIAGSEGLRALTGQVAAIRAGRLRYFFAQEGELSASSHWHRNPFTAQETSATAHWSRVPMYSAESGDIKFIWEPGRFASAFALARGGWLLGDENCAETFWQLIESWTAANPPNHGAHWKCGQESSFRILAWCFALYVFADSSATTPERIALLVGAMAAQADRISRDHVYAHLQRNNHAISEGVGLWTIGLLFPELQNARQWREQGREILVREAHDQIAADGSYVQNSTNYHRLMLHDYFWAIRLGELCEEPLPASVSDRVGAAVVFLDQLLDEQTGRVPNYGNNDGALILPLNSCDYKDFRPVLATGNYLTRRVRAFDSGPWNEDLVWLYGPSALEAPIKPTARHSIAASDGGYYVLRGPASFALTRCISYRYRPAQADMLALDLWWRGKNVCCDAGTYLYYADAPWANSLVRTRVHNTVSIDGEDQMASGPRFMWFDWTKAELLCLEKSASGFLEIFQGQHFGYSRLADPVIHRRAIVRCGDDLWIVVDDLLGEATHELSCQWLLQGKDHHLSATENRLRVGLDGGSMHLQWHAEGFSPDVTRGRERVAPRGWKSQYYGVKVPAVSLSLGGNIPLPSRMISVFSFGEDPVQIQLEDHQFLVDDHTRISLAPLEATHRFSVLRLESTAQSGSHFIEVTR